MKLTRVLLLVFVILAACFITFQITYSETDKFWKNKVTDMLESSQSEALNDLSELSEIVDDNYLNKIDEEYSSQKVMEGFVSSLDRFSMYMDEGEYQEYLAIRNSSSSSGIGVNTLYDSRLSGLYIVNVYKGSPAELAGIVPGDIITHVGGVSVKELGFYGAMSEIGMGRKNTSVNVVVRKLTGESVSLDIVRNDVTIESMTGEKLGKKIGYIRINSFSEGDEQLFRNVIEKLVTSNCEKFILDVRNNSGGNIETISKILDMLLKDGEMFSITDKSGITTTYSSDVKSMPYPLAVLINEGTVCGAEVFAAVLSESEQASLFGTQTYGKATVQSVFELSDGDAVSLSTLAYTLKGGKTFDGVGVKPDATVELPMEYRSTFTTLAKENDALIQAAMTYLETQRMSSAD